MSKTKSELEAELECAEDRIRELSEALARLDNAIADLPCWEPGDSLETVRKAKLLVYNWHKIQDELERIVRYFTEDEDKPRYAFLHGTKIEQVAQVLNAYDRERRAAIATFGAFQEHVLISLQAMLLIAKQTYGMTHRQKNARMDVLCDTIGEAIANISGDRDRGWYHFDEAPFSVKNWDVRQLAATKFRLERDAKQYEHLVELVNQYNPELLEQWQASTKQPKRDTLPF